MDASSSQAKKHEGIPLEDEQSPITQILVATDFSVSAQHALAWGLSVAQQHGASVQIVHAVPEGTSDEMRHELERVVSTRLADAERLVRDAGVHAAGIFRPGNPWDVVSEAGADADLIVVGARGHTTLADLALGSTADRILRTAEPPVVTVHIEDVIPALGVRTAMVAIDFSEESIRAIDVTVRLLEGSSEPDRLILLHAVEVPPVFALYEVGAGFQATQDADLKEARQQLESIAVPLRSDRLTVDVVAESAYPSTFIEEIARREKVDLVALGTHGRSGMKRLFMGSLAERTVRHAPCPVLTVRTRE